MKRVVISGYYGYNNLGDEAILKGIISAFKQIKIKTPEIVVLSSSPQFTAETYNVKAIKCTNLYQIINNIKKSDLFISGGGSLIQDITGWKSIPYYLGLILLAQLMNKKTVIYAQGIGPVNNNYYKKLISWTLNRCQLVSVRDRRSFDLLIKMGVNEKKIKETVDPVFSIDIEQIKKRKIEINKNKTKPVLGVSIRPWGKNNYLEKLAQMINYIIKFASTEVLILPLYYSQDYQISKKLETLIDTECKIISEQNNPLDMIKIFSQVDFLIGVRLHSLIFAALNRTPFVGISYDPKTDSFLELFKNNYSFSMTEFNNLEGWEDIIKNSWLKREDFAIELENMVKKFHKKSLNNVQSVLKII